MAFPFTLRSDLPLNRNLKIGKPEPRKEDKNISESEKRIVQDLETYRTIVHPTSEPDDVIGHEDIIISIEDAFISKFKTEISNSKGGIQTFLLVGNPGNGKTSIMKNSAIYVAQSLGKPISLFTISASKVLSKWVGESQKFVRLLYELAEKYSPSLLLYDEVDSIMKARKEDQSEHSRQFQTELLTQMDGIESKRGIITVASTNRGFDLDESFIRRFHRRYYVREPNSVQRIELLKKAIIVETGNLYFEHSNLKLDVKEIIRKTNGFTGSQIFEAVRDATSATVLHQVNGKLMHRDEYRNFHSQRKGKLEAENIELTMGSLTYDILMKEGIERICVSYDKYEADKMRKWVRENCYNGRENNTEHMQSNTRKTSGCCLFAFSNAC